MKGYIWRSMFGPWVAVLVLVVEVAYALTDGAPWRGDLVWTAGFEQATLVLSAPLLAAAVAVDTARLLSAGQAHLALDHRARHRTIWLAILAGTVPVAVVHLLVASGTWIVSMSSGHDFSVSLGTAVQPFVQIAILYFFACLGSLVGRFAPAIVAGVVAAVMTLVVILGAANADHGWVTMLSIAGSQAPMLGQEFASAYAVRQMAALLVSGTVIALVPLERRGRARVPTPWLAPLGVLVVLLLAYVPPSGPATHRLAAASAEPTDCAGSSVTICTYKEHSRLRGDTVDAIELLVTAAQREGYDAFVPARVVEVPNTSTDPVRLGRGELTWSFDSYDSFRGLPLALDQVASALLTPRQCPQLYGDQPPTEAYWNDLNSLMVTWVSLAGAESQYAMLDGVHAFSTSDTAVAMERLQTCAF